VGEVIQECAECQLVREIGAMKSGVEELQSIPFCEFFSRVTLDTADPSPETKRGNMHLLLAIDNYST
jgi:hypothetical protein